MSEPKRLTEFTEMTTHGPFDPATMPGEVQNLIDAGEITVQAPLDPAALINQLYHPQTINFIFWRRNATGRATEEVVEVQGRLSDVTTVDSESAEMQFTQTQVTPGEQP